MGTLKEGPEEYTVVGKKHEIDGDGDKYSITIQRSHREPEVSFVDWEAYISVRPGDTLHRYFRVVKK